ncbi:MAG: hypothetical protein Q9P01_04665 [Anaerolineae bacterium]|nr:hypothetical protein [Anaerolineae bacterium]
MKIEWYDYLYNIGKFIGGDMTNPIRFFSGIVFVLTLAACGCNVVPTPTVPPRPTATPFSIPLPDVPTVIPVGFSEENPLRLVIAASDTDTAEDLVGELESQLAGRTALSLEVSIADSQSGALAAVCNPRSGQVSAAWIDGLTLIGAFGQECGIPVLQIQRGTGRNAKTGESGVLLSNLEALETSSQDTGLAIVADNTFCRTTYTDLYSWVIPTMMLRGAGYDIADLNDVDEYADYDELLAEVSTGACTAIGLPQTVWEDYAAADDDEEDDDSLAETVRLVENQQKSHMVY